MTAEDGNGRQLDRIMEDIRDIKIGQERLRGEFAAGFTPRDIHNMEMRNAEKEIATVKKQQEDDMLKLEKQREKDEAQSIGKNERLWLRVGSLVGIAALLIALLEYLQRVH